MNVNLVRPAPEKVVKPARAMPATIEADPEFSRLRTACAKYDEDWTSFMGYAIGEWDHGDYTHQVYRAAWGPTMNQRCWFGKEETAKRRAAVMAKYQTMGILDGGRRFLPGFAQAR
ncbi:hypothetical protein [Streptomyces rimosus]|uniref:hypothetical protein n=1 Tax=Streptomyces rimosus TaxID=1927 RepID=UPI0004C928FD|nr:hypothetical protein [Streptomyces rimosus]